MQLRSWKSLSIDLPRPIVPCAQCGDMLLAPQWSEHLDDCHIRHLWCCTACGYQFETLVRYPASGTPAN